jgi:thiol-disulfide isomerase/thioredoxin
MFTLALLAAMFAAPDETVIVYTSDACPPCKALKRDYAVDPELFGEREVHFINIDGKPVKDVSAVPTFVLIRDWKEIERRTGYGGPESLRSWLQ